MARETTSESAPVGSIIQTIANSMGIFLPMNGSWIQSFCMDSNGDQLTEPINGDWYYTFAYLMWEQSPLRYIYDDNDEIIGENEFEIIGQDMWRTIAYWSGAIQALSKDPSIEFPINGSWIYTFYAYVAAMSSGTGGGGKEK